MPRDWLTRLSNSALLRREQVSTRAVAVHSVPLGTRSLIVADFCHLTSGGGLVLGTASSCLLASVLRAGTTHPGPGWWVDSLAKSWSLLKKIFDSIFRKRPIHLISSGSWCWCLDSEKEGLHTTRYLTLGDKISTNLSCFLWRHSFLQFKLRIWVDSILSEEIQKSRTSKTEPDNFLPTFRFISFYWTCCT